MYDLIDPQPDFAALEEATLARWQEEGTFAASLRQREGCPRYTIYDGPPTANALPPLHTALPMAFKDLVGRYQTMRGHYVPRQAGWDTHGLPVEVQVEKALGLSGKQAILNLVPGDEAASIRSFNESCRRSVWEFKQEWDRFVPRVGYWTDTANPYITYERAYVEGVWGVFKRIWDKGLVSKGHKVVPYCPRCGTTLSAAEVAQGYADVHDTAVTVAFPLVGQPKRSLLAWTTTPWTLPGNVALAVGPEIRYATVQLTNGEEYILAKDRLGTLKAEYEIIDEQPGSDLVGMRYQPLFPEVTYPGTQPTLHTVLAAEFVSTEEGTGIVHTAVMYGEDDYALGKTHGLPEQHTVGPDGCFLSTVPSLAGQYIRDAQPGILATLKEKGRLVAKESITHSYPFCWRCKTALIYYAKDSWFITMSRCREALQEANAAVEWYPAHFKDGRFGDFIREARDWAVSRERFWGSPLPIWVSPSGKYLCIGSITELRELAEDPSLVGDDFDPHRPQVDAVVLVKDGERYTREPLVLDVWFDSGAMPYATGWAAKGWFPADYIAEAVDQTRGWFYSLMAIGTVLDNRSPYRRVSCMGHLVDEHGKKMSKSVGNTFNPWDAFKVYGVDAIRWFIYTVNSPGEAKAFGMKELGVRFRKSVLLLWNVFNYFGTYANLEGASVPTEAEVIAQRTGAEDILDRWILARQAEVVSAVTEEMERYDFLKAGRLLEEYLGDLSTWYLRRSRGRSDAAFFITMYDVLITLVTLLAPFMPFVTDHIYRVLRRSDAPASVHLLDWPSAVQVGDWAAETLEGMAAVRRSVELGLAVRAGEGVKVRQPLRRVVIHGTSTSLLTRLAAKTYQETIADELNVEEVQIGPVPETYPTKSDGLLTVGLDTTLDADLITRGLAREFQRQLQNLRKQRGLVPGQTALLLVGSSERASIEALLDADPQLLIRTYLRLDSVRSWTETGEDEITLDGRSITIGLLPDPTGNGKRHSAHVEPV